MHILETTAVIAAILAFLATITGTFELLLATTGAVLRQTRHVVWKQRNCRLAVVIPAHNEEAFIARAVASVSAAAATCYSRPEIVVVADNCNDQTATQASQAGARVLVRTNLEKRGKGYALQMAFESLIAEGFEAFLVIDADSFISSNLIREVAHRLDEGAAAVQCRYQVSNHSASVRTRLMDLAFLAFNVVRPRGRCGWGLSCGILGNGFGVRLETLQKIAYNASSIVEDLEYHLRLITNGEQVDFIDAATVYGEVPVGAQAARVQRSRWEGGRLRILSDWGRRLATGTVRGQWRCVEPLVDLLGLPLAYQFLLLSFLLVFPGMLRVYAEAALLLIALYVLVAAILGGHPGKSILALVAAPFYIVWKITTLEKVFSASRKSANWERTARDHEVGLRPVD
jgi:cellulose synthase/poly-beta-1,6-N-acetylglucosamine synthase-like glycosyltransferase